MFCAKFKSAVLFTFDANKGIELKNIMCSYWTIYYIAKIILQPLLNKQYNTNFDLTWIGVGVGVKMAASVEKSVGIHG